MEEQQQEYGRPRRPDAETVSYLRGLPLDEAAAATEVRAYLDAKKNAADAAATLGTPSNPDDDDETPEFPSVVAAAHSALSEILRDFASLSCDEHSSSVLESLVRIATRYSGTARRAALSSLEGYTVFLATHRFGSHVVQTVLSCCGAEYADDLDEEEEGREVVQDSYDGDGLASLPELILGVAREVRPYAAELAVHVCGSHVLRSALCLLAGVELTGNSGAGGFAGNGAPLRGKFKDKKKKKKKKGAPEAGGEENRQRQREAAVLRLAHVAEELAVPSVQAEFDAELKELASVLSFAGGSGDENDGNDAGPSPPGELQKNSCHPSAGPLLALLLRVLSYRDAQKQIGGTDGNIGKTNEDPNAASADRRLGILPEEAKFRTGSDAHAFVKRLLCWDDKVVAADGAKDDEKAPRQKYAGDVIYGLSGEPRGSVVLESILRTSPDDVRAAVCRTGGFYDAEAFADYGKHGVSNFVVQTVMASATDKEEVERLAGCVCAALEDGSMLGGGDRGGGKKSDGGGGGDDKDKGKDGDSPPVRSTKRTGLVWRAAEMCARSGAPQDQERFLRALMRGYAAAAGGEPNDNDDDAAAPPGDDEEEGRKPRKKKERTKKKGFSAKECIPRLLGLNPSADGGDEFDEYGNDGYGGSHKDSGRLTVDAAGARALHHIFKFAPRLRKEWVEGFVKLYGRGDLVRMANDGLCSLCIMDGLLDGPAKSEASKLLLDKLAGRLSFLAAERCGHHVVLKLFRALPSTDDKAVVSAELSQSLNRLGSNSMGRTVMTSCAAGEFLEGEKVWKEALTKLRERENWMRDITGEGGGGDEEDTGGPASKKRKKVEHAEAVDELDTTKHGEHSSKTEVGSEKAVVVDPNEETSDNDGDRKDKKKKKEKKKKRKRNKQ